MPSKSLLSGPAGPNYQGEEEPLYTGSISTASGPQQEVETALEKRSFLSAVVDKHDTLEDISRRYQVPAHVIASANNLGGRPIKPGQLLAIPIYY